MRRRLIGFALALGTLLATVLLLASPASAHATVVGSTPVDGSKLATAPSSVEVDFDQAVSIGGDIGYLHVIDQVGRRVDVGATEHPGGDASKISVALKSGLGDGTYTASFRIISADSHPVAGSVRFVVGNGSFAAAVAAPPTVNAGTSATFSVVRWIAFAGFALLGGGWLMFSVWPAGRDDRRARRLLWAGWWVSVLGAVAEVAVQGPYAAGTGLSSLKNTALLDATLHTDYGLAHSLRLIALGALCTVLGLLLRQLEAGRGKPGRGRLEQLGGLLVVGIAITFAASGHASSEHPQWLAMSSDTVHLLSMAIWVGGLVVLFAAVLPRREPAELRAVLPVFSRVAYLCVSALAITGTYQAVLGLGSWRALFDTSYGRLVLIKVGLFLVLIALGNLSRMTVQRRWVRLPVAYAMTDTGLSGEELTEAERDGRGPDSGGTDEIESGGNGPEPAVGSDAVVGAGGVRALRRSVLAELVVAAVVLAFTAILIAEPPGPAALITLDARPQTVTAKLDGGRTAAITLSSRTHGDLSVTVALTAGAKPEVVTATAALPAKQLGPITVPVAAQAGGSDTYSASGVLFPSAGSWLITLTVQTSEFDSTVTQTTVTLH